MRGYSARSRSHRAAASASSAMVVNLTGRASNSRTRSSSQANSPAAAAASNASRVRAVFDFGNVTYLCDFYAVKLWDRKLTGGKNKGKEDSRLHPSRLA